MYTVRCGGKKKKKEKKRKKEKDPDLVCKSPIDYSLRGEESGEKRNNSRDCTEYSLFDF